ncbi:MAG: type IX secretion system membrane protein PorP/SprF [Flavobacteriales bacterium]|nr:type IX secretion system membrane protein PorP/SprF [Flavobacteriales bacterium]
MKKLVVILFCVPVFVFAQQLPTQSLYQYDISLINPGYSVSVKAAQINIHHRSQWVGFNEAPNTQTLTFVKRIDDKKFGYGMYVFNDRYGPFQRVGFNISGSYDLQITDEIKVGLGLSAALQQFNVNKDKIELYHSDDDVVNNSVSGSVWSPDFAFGAYAYHNKFYVGFSILHLVTNDVKPYRNQLNNGYLDGNLKNVRHFYLIGGYNWELNENITIIPNVFWDYAKIILFIYKEELRVNTRGFWM